MRKKLFEILKRGGCGDEENYDKEWTVDQILKIFQEAIGEYDETPSLTSDKNETIQEFDRRITRNLLRYEIREKIK